uniref:Beta-1,4-glucuronyltransferase 1-like n=1 Tax=Hirondellea gigas TaxID=1518452 RepID=A0A2P2I064_9CRUS
MKMWYAGKWWRPVAIAAVLVLMICAMFKSYFIACGLLSCADSTRPVSSNTQHSNAVLADLNGIEICLSIKFVDPIQRLELTGSPQLGEDGPYSVVYNYLRPSRFYGVNETVTYTTHSTPEFMENVGAVAERWDGPVSVALYVPFTDFCRTIHRMIYLRNCDKAAYREKVAWHIFWLKESPPPTSWRLVPDETHIDCDKLGTDYKHNEDLRNTWRTAQKLLYPVNVARNIARKASTTWFVLPSDVELYPSLGLASQFMKYIKESSNEPVKQLVTAIPGDVSPTLYSLILKVFVVPVFEVEKVLPDTKEELMIQYARNTAVYFHRMVCPHCQRFPGLREWINKPGIPGQIHALSWSYRNVPYHRWEPIFVCSMQEPYYEERLSWEGLQDKMTQMHELCLRGYQFHLLDRAFLVHAVGIKKRKKGMPSYPSWRQLYIEQNDELYDKVLWDLESKYGRNDLCQRH